MADKLVEIPITNPENKRTFRIRVPKGSTDEFIQKAAEDYENKYYSKIDEPKKELQDTGFLKSLAQSIVGIGGAVAEPTNPNFPQQLAVRGAQKAFDFAGIPPEYKQDYLGTQAVENIPGASTVSKAIHGNIPGAIGDIIPSLLLGGTLESPALAGGVRGAVQGSVKGAFPKPWRGIPVPAPLITAIGGEILGNRLGHPEVGMAIGGAYPFVHGAVEGAFQGMRGKPLFNPKATPPPLQAEFADPWGSVTPMNRTANIPPEVNYYPKDTWDTNKPPQGAKSDVFAGRQIPNERRLTGSTPGPPFRTRGAIPLGPEAGPYAGYPSGTAPENMVYGPPTELPPGAPPPLQIGPGVNPLIPPYPASSTNPIPMGPAVQPFIPGELPAGVGNRSGTAIPLAPAERVPGTGRFGPPGTKSIRDQYYNKTIDITPYFEEKPAANASKTIQPETKQVQPAPAHEAPASKLKSPAAIAKEALSKLPNQVISPETAQLPYISKETLYKMAEKIGPETKPTELARWLLENGYDVEPSKFGGGKWGLERTTKTAPRPKAPNKFDKLVPNIIKANPDWIL